MLLVLKRRTTRTFALVFGANHQFVVFYRDVQGLPGMFLLADLQPARPQDQFRM